MKARVNVTVDEPLVDWMDMRVKEKRFASRSHAVTVALMELQKKEVVRL